MQSLAPEKKLSSLERLQPIENQTQVDKIETSISQRIIGHFKDELPKNLEIKCEITLNKL